MIEAELADNGGQSNRRKVAELSRPGRAFSEKTRNKSKHKRKRKHEPQNAKYTNWFTPFMWTQITIAARQAGHKMSATEIVRILKSKDPSTFRGLNRSTVYDWIDYSGTQPCWKQSVYERAEKGNDPGHSKGGRRGILVSLIVSVCQVTYP